MPDSSSALPVIRQAGRVIAQNLENPTVCDSIAAAFAKHPREFLAQGFQSGDPDLDLLQLLMRDAIHIFA